MATDEFDQFQRQLRNPNLEIEIEGPGTEQDRIAALEAEIQRQRNRRTEEKRRFEAEANQLKAKLGRLQASTGAARVEDLEHGPSGNTAPIDGSVAQDVVRALTSIEGALSHLHFSIATQAGQQQGITGRGIQHFMGDTKSLIREFHGTETAEQASAWLREIKNSATLYEWTEAVKFSVAKARLRGAALKWLMSKSAELKDFQTF